MYCFGKIFVRSMYEIVRKYTDVYGIRHKQIVNECTTEGEKKERRKEILFGNNIKLSFLL